MNSFFVLHHSASISTSPDYAGYVIFYKKSKDASISDIQTGLFSKLIENALKLKLDNFLFIDIAVQKNRYSVLMKTIDINKCFLFGVKESEVGINFDIPLYKLISFASKEFLKVDAPELLEIDKNLKNQLWAQLQISFKLN